LFAAARSPIYVLDGQRRIVYCNPACRDLLGLESESLIGQRCDYQTTAPGVAAPDVVASLCPPPEVFSETALRTELKLLRADGSLLDRRVHFHALAGDASECLAVVAIISEADSDAAAHSEAAELHRRLWALRREVLPVCQVDELIGSSPPIERARQLVEVAVRGQVRTLIYGPAGSGREHVARLLHQRSCPDLFGQLVPLCCPLLDAELLQSTIAGLVRQFGVSDGQSEPQDAQRTRVPTLLLLEVDQLNDEAQAELAGLLALPTFELCAISTSEHSLTALSDRGAFREDLAFALSTIMIELPPLCRRREDIPLLCQHFLEKTNAQGDHQLSGFSPEALDELAGYEWPENIDELSEVVELACRAAKGPVVEAEDLPRQIHWAATAAAHPPKPDEPIDLDAFLAGIEKELMVRALRRSKGNKTRAARLLGVNRARFHRRLEYFELS
jgi:DNA-binding NtrC family response regulator